MYVHAICGSLNHYITFYHLAIYNTIHSLLRCPACRYASTRTHVISRRPRCILIILVIVGSAGCPVFHIPYIPPPY